MNTQNTHTPGPWKAHPSPLDSAQVPCITGPDGWNIATCTHWENHDRPTENANARLIAASPALLEALEKFVECADMQKGAGMTMLQMSFSGPALTSARELIRQAKGEA